MSSFAACLRCFIFPKSGQGSTGQVFASVCKLTPEPKFGAWGTDALSGSLINEDERLLAVKEWMLHASTGSGELGFALVLLERSSANSCSTFIFHLL